MARLMEDDDVGNKKGIYAYVLTGDKRRLNLRAFSSGQKHTAYERQKGICTHKKRPKKGKRLEIKEMKADHITPWSKGAKTTQENGQMLCRECNRCKSNK